MVQLDPFLRPDCFVLFFYFKFKAMWVNVIDGYEEHYSSYPKNNHKDEKKAMWVVYMKNIKHPVRPEQVVDG